MPSLVEIGPVVLEKKMKMWKVYRRTDRQTDRQTDGQTDGQTDDGRQVIRKAHLSFQLRWAKKSYLNHWGVIRNEAHTVNVEIKRLRQTSRHGVAGHGCGIWFHPGFIWLLWLWGLDGSPSRGRLGFGPGTTKMKFQIYTIKSMDVNIQKFSTRVEFMFAWVDISGKWYRSNLTLTHLCFGTGLCRGVWVARGGTWLVDPAGRVGMGLTPLGLALPSGSCRGSYTMTTISEL
mgnify:CR=1 FL=1